MGREHERFQIQIFIRIELRIVEIRTAALLHKRFPLLKD